MIAPLALLITLLAVPPAFAQSPDASQPAAAPASRIHVTQASQSLRLTVGHMVFLDSPLRVRRIYIANPAILDSYTANPNQLVVTAKALGVTSVVLWDESDAVHTYTVTVDTNVEAVRTAMDRALPHRNIQIESNETRVLLTGTVASLAEIDIAGRIAGQFSKDIVNSLVINTALIPQVRLKVRIVEVDRSRLEQFGINLFNPGGGNIVAIGSTTQFSSSVSLSSGTGASATGSTVGGNTLTVSDPLNFLFYSAKANLGITVRDLENKQILQILAEPNITSLSGQKASFLAGGEFPFPVVQSSTGTTSVTIQFRPYGVKLDFLPEVNPDGTITLKVAPEVSALDYTNAVTIAGYTIPALSTRHADTQVVLRSGQSFAISGLLDRRTTDILSKTPGIAKIPILGQLFKSKNVNLSTSELIVIVTPTIVDPLNEQADPDVSADTPATVRPFLNAPKFDQTVPVIRKAEAATIPGPTAAPESKP
jgi:pilus assembly protein CpaC